jgi:hypothetical protein
MTGWVLAALAVGHTIRGPLSNDLTRISLTCRLCARYFIALSTLGADRSGPDLAAALVRAHEARCSARRTRCNLHRGANVACGLREVRVRVQEEHFGCNEDVRNQDLLGELAFRCHWPGFTICERTRYSSIKQAPTCADAAAP